jgi:beta-glucosidase
MDENLPAILYAWQPGTRGGDAVADILSGEYNPSGRLVVSFPRNVGQIPIFYNTRTTGRPFRAEEKYTSKYLDVPNDPLYPFGYGLSYTSFEYSPPRPNATGLSRGDSLFVSVTVTNSGPRRGEETAQLYIRDMVGSVTRPVMELKGFRKVLLDPGQQETITFTITEKDLEFYDINMNLVAEPGEFRVYTGPNSRDVQEASFTLTR